MIVNIILQLHETEHGRLMACADEFSEYHNSVLLLGEDRADLDPDELVAYAYRTLSRDIMSAYMAHYAAVSASVKVAHMRARPRKPGETKEIRLLERTVLYDKHMVAPMWDDNKIMLESSSPRHFLRFSGRPRVPPEGAVRGGRLFFYDGTPYVDIRFAD